jgi:hypothetical protein
MLTSDPFMARPIGERAAETMTASGITASSGGVWSEPESSPATMRAVERPDEEPGNRT